MPHQQRSHQRKYGKGARGCRITGMQEGLIRKYGLNICRRAFREQANQIGFFKYKWAIFRPSSWSSTASHAKHDVSANLRHACQTLPSTTPLLHSHENSVIPEPPIWMDTSNSQTRGSVPMRSRWRSCRAVSFSFNLTPLARQGRPHPSKTERTW